MVGSISSGAALQHTSTSIAAPQQGQGAKLDLNSIPQSKVKVEALHTESGKGLKIDIKV